MLSASPPMRQRRETPKVSSRPANRFDVSGSPRHHVDGDYIAALGMSHR